MKIKIGKKYIGDDQSVFVIAELSANHLGNFDLAIKTIKAAKEAGADAVKLQTYTADTITIDVKNKYFTIKQGTLWDGRTLYNLYEEAFTPWEWQPKLKKYANSIGLECFSSAFDFTAVDFLNKINVPAHKVASYEINDIPLIEHMAKSGKPMIMSTGTATLNDIYEGVEACRRVGNNQIVLLKCTSAYPTPYEDVNLRTIPNIKETFKTEVGLSDHTLGIAIPIGAVSLGAKVIEKHFILDKNFKGVDSAFSIDPGELKELVRSVRQIEKALGQVNYELTEKMKKNKELRRSLFIVKDIKKGEAFTKKYIRSIRPGYGLAPKFIKEILGKKARKDIKRGTPVSWDLLL